MTQSILAAGGRGAGWDSCAIIVPRRCGIAYRWRRGEGYTDPAFTPLTGAQDPGPAQESVQRCKCHPGNCSGRIPVVCTVGVSGTLHASISIVTYVAGLPGDAVLRASQQDWLIVFGRIAVSAGRSERKSASTLHWSNVSQLRPSVELVVGTVEGRGRGRGAAAWGGGRRVQARTLGRSSSVQTPSTQHSVRPRSHLRCSPRLGIPGRVRQLGKGLRYSIRPGRNRHRHRKAEKAAAAGRPRSHS